MEGWFFTINGCFERSGAASQNREPESESGALYTPATTHDHENLYKVKETRRVPGHRAALLLFRAPPRHHAPRVLAQEVV